MISKEQEAALRRPFDPDNEIEWRVQRVTKNKKAVCVAYVTARAIMDRLDEVFGVDNWTVSYRTVALGKNEGFICTITAGGVHKEDISDLTDVEPLKGGVSGALKRCAVLFGIGRYLYDLGEETVQVEDGFPPKGCISVKLPDNGGYGFVRRPKLPDWARPQKPAKPEPDVSTGNPSAETSEVVVEPPPADGPNHDPEWVDGGNRRFMHKFSAVFKHADGYSYDMLADFLESIGKPRPSVMTKEARENLLKWLFNAGKPRLKAYVEGVLKQRQELQ